MLYIPFGFCNSVTNKRGCANDGVSVEDPAGLPILAVEAGLDTGRGLLDVGGGLVADVLVQLLELHVLLQGLADWTRPAAQPVPGKPAPHLVRLYY